MSDSIYSIIELVISFMALQLILIQVFIYAKQKDAVYIWSIIVGILVFVYAFIEFHISKSTYPVFGEILVKVQHSAITLYPLALLMFWKIFLKQDKYRKILKTFSIIAGICLFAIWFTNFHLSGEFKVKTLNKGGLLGIEIWDYSRIGFFVYIEMIFHLSSYIFVIFYLYRTASDSIKSEKKYFAIAYIFNFLCIINDICVWTGTYEMFQVLAFGHLAILTSLVYILSSKQHNIFLEAKRLNRQLDQTVKERTQELEDVNKNLEERVQERTEDIMKKEAQLAQTSKMESLGLLASGVAHDMNNVLLSITGNLQLIQDAEMRNGAVSKIKTALKSCSKAKDLIGRLYTFSTQKGENLHLENISDSVNLSLMIFKGSSKFLRINLTEPEIPVYAYIDSTSFMSLLLNLFINARDAMKKEGTLSISFEKEVFPNPEHPRRVPRQEYVHITVSDTGSGISDEDAANIWSPFFTTKKQGKGTGLGLAMAREVMKKHGGDIWFESKAGIGTTFHLLVRTGMPGVHNEYIPLQQLELPELLNIMLVEDRSDSVEVISDFLRSFGYTPTVFEHSTDALSAFKTESELFDILLTDYALPEMNGIELARECKTIRPDFPVILFSGNIQENPTSPYIERFIAKPFSPLELKNLMLDVIRTRN